MSLPVDHWAPPLNYLWHTQDGWAAQIIKGIYRKMRKIGWRKTNGVRFIWPHAGSCKLKDLFFTIELWRGDRNKSTCSRNHHIVQAPAGAVDHQQISVFIGLLFQCARPRIKAIAWLGLAPGNICAVGMLGIGARPP